MALDAQKMAKFAAESIDEIEQIAHFNEGELGEILIIAEVKNIPIDGTDELATAVRYICTDDRFWVARGLLEAALDSNRHT